MGRRRSNGFAGEAEAVAEGSADAVAEAVAEGSAEAEAEAVAEALGAADAEAVADGFTTAPASCFSTSSGFTSVSVFSWGLFTRGQQLCTAQIRSAKGPDAAIGPRLRRGRR